MAIKQNISNLPELEVVKREIEVLGLTLDLQNKRCEFFYKINHIVDGKKENEIFTSAKPKWEITNDYEVLIRDESMNPIPNPEFKEQTNEEGEVINESERFLKSPAFDLFINQQIKPMLEPMLKAYIQLNDSLGIYNVKK